MKQMSDINFANVARGVWIVVLVVALILSALLSYPLMLLWNIALVPAIVILNPVSWMQMWGIFVLVTILINGVTVKPK